MESQLNAFIGKKRQDGLATATLQVYFAAVRSFFEIHYYPLIMRKGDYPKGESLGVRVATKEAILKVIENKHTRNKKQLTALILFLKDSGLRRSDAVLLNYEKVAEGLEKGDSIIPITLVTEKQHTIAKTFIGEEAIRALKDYLKERRTGTENVPPEIILDKSPLFRTQESGKVKRISKSGFSNIIREAFLRVGEANVSPHSLRKFLQTNLEAGNVNVNWIDQILGHTLINSRDAYSKPTDEQLKEAYIKAYDHKNIKNQTQTTEAIEQPVPQSIQPANRDLPQVIELLKQGISPEMITQALQILKKNSS
jgi:integrase